MYECQFAKEPSVLYSIIILSLINLREVCVGIKMDNRMISIEIYTLDLPDKKK